MSKNINRKYANNMRLNLPTGEDCLNANEQLTQNLKTQTEEYAKLMWDKLGTRIVCAVVGHTFDRFQADPDARRFVIGPQFIRNNAFSWNNRDMDAETKRACIEVWHTFKCLPDNIDSSMNDYYARLIIGYLIDELSDYGYRVSMTVQASNNLKYFLNPGDSWDLDYSIFITPVDEESVLATLWYSFKDYFVKTFTKWGAECRTKRA